MVFYDKVKILGGLLLWQNERRSLYIKKMTDEKHNIIHQFFEEYAIER